MGLISCLLGGNSDKVGEEDSEEYDVCGQHGHDFREDKPGDLKSEFRKSETNYPVENGIVKAAVPGMYLGVQYLLRGQVAPCRDCSKERTRDEILETRIPFKKDGEVKSVTHSHYKSLVEEYEAEQ
jgi:hypothetical protein